MNISKLSSSQSTHPFDWNALVLAVVAFWFSSSAFLDFLLMPMMYETGMMNEPNFATAGYSIFWLFNRVELLCGAAILTGLLVIRQREQNREFSVIDSGLQSRWAMLLSSMLLAIAFTFTYFLTPQMSALGIHLSGVASEPVPNAMGHMHLLYWGLEAIKLFAAGWLIQLCYRDTTAA
ncbi:MAG: DUF4149 domain-containing protein [Phormidesmis sp.]